jgi:hypothetical protein
MRHGHPPLGATDVARSPTHPPASPDDARAGLATSCPMTLDPKRGQGNHAMPASVRRAQWPTSSSIAIRRAVRYLAEVGEARTSDCRGRPSGPTLTNGSQEQSVGPTVGAVCRPPGCDANDEPCTRDEPCPMLSDSPTSGGSDAVRRQRQRRRGVAVVFAIAGRRWNSSGTRDVGAHRLCPACSYGGARYREPLASE